MKKYITTIVLLFFGIGFLIFNRINLDIYKGYSLLMDIQLIGLILSLVSILILAFFKKFRKNVVYTYLLIFAVLIVTSELVLIYKSFEKIDRTEFINSYNNKNCEELLERLEFDKTQHKFAYFSYGLVVDSDAIAQEFKKKYNATIIPIAQGCIGVGENNCYNKALIDFLESKK